MAVCPNTNSKEWKNLVSKVGEEKAWELFSMYDDIPTIIPSETTIDKSNTKPEEVRQALNDLATSLGIDIQLVNSIKDSKGNEISALAKASILNKTIQYLEGFESQLPEEIVHFAIEALGSNNPLYQAMYDRIERFDVYSRVKEDYAELYKDKPNAEELFRKEAMGQLLLQTLKEEQTSEDENLNSYSRRFLGRVIDYLKRLFTGNGINKFRRNIVDLAPFSKVAQAIKERNFELFEEANLTQDIELYSNNRFNVDISKLPEAQKKVVTALIDNDKRTVPLSHKHGYGFTLDNGKVVESIKTVSDRATKMRAARTELQKKQDKLAAEFGTKAHDYMYKAAQVVFQGMDKSILDKSYPEFLGAKEEVLSFLNNLKSQFPENSVFLPEVRMFDIDSKEGGTSDLIIVEPSGKKHFIDYKFQNFNKSEIKKGIIQFYKSKNWVKQLEGYKQITDKITKNNDTGRTLIIPGSIEGSLSIDGVFVPTSFKIGKLDAKSKTFKSDNPKEKDFLDPVALRTDTLEDSSLQEFINKGEALFEDLIDQKEKAKDEESFALATKLNKLRKSLNKLKVESSIRDLVEYANDEFLKLEGLLESIEEGKDLSPITEEMGKYKSFIKFIQSVREASYDSTTLTEEQSKQLSDLEVKASRLDNKMSKVNKKQVEMIALNQIGTAELDTVKADTILGSIFENMSKSENKFVNIAYGLFEDARIKIQDKNKKDIQNITNVTDNFRKVASSKGLSLQQAFDKLLDKNEKGEKTGRLLRVWDKKYFDKRKEAIENSNVNWFKDNTLFDDVAYQKAYDAKKASLEKKFEKFKKKDELIKKELASFTESFDVRVNSLAYFNNNKYVKPLSKWQSAEWKQLNSPENKWLKDYYDFFTKTIQDLELPVFLSESFIPKIEKSLVESMVRGNAWTAFTDQFMKRSREDFGNYDIDGNVKREVPLYWINQIAETSKESAALQSYDLSRILAMFTTMGNSYNYKKEIEHQVLSVRDALTTAKILPNGSSLLNQITNQVKNTTQESRTLDYLDSMIDSYLYGIKTKGEKTSNYQIERNKEDSEGNPILDEQGNPIKETVTKKFSWDRFLLKNRSFSTLVFLSGNTLSILANGLGGMMNSAMLATKGRFYNKKQLWNAHGMLVSNKAKELREHFDLFNSQDVELQINKLSSSKLVSWNLADKAMIAQRKTDELISSTIMLSLAQGYTVREGKLVKAAKGEQTLIQLGEKGLLDKVIPKGSKAYKQLQRMTYALTEKAIGNSSREQLNLAKLSTTWSLMTHLRSWVVPMARERAGELSFDADLNTYEQGKFISAFKVVVRDGYLSALKNLPLMLLNPSSKHFDGMIEKIYNDYLQQGTFDVDAMSLEEFKEMYVGNMKGARAELLMYSILVLAMFGLKADDDDDDETKRLKQFVYSYVKRTSDEVGFFISPGSAKEVFKRTIMIPSFSVLWDVPAAGSELVKYGFEKAFSDEEITAKPEKFFKTVPPVRGIYNFTDSLLEAFADKD